MVTRVSVTAPALSPIVVVHRHGEREVKQHSRLIPILRPPSKARTTHPIRLNEAVPKYAFGSTSHAAFK